MDDRPTRIVIERVSPEVDGGRFPVKRAVGETVVVEADVFADGHDVLRADVVYHPPAGSPLRLPMVALGNDRWRGEFTVTEIGEYRFTIEAWVDGFRTWQRDLGKRLGAGTDVSVDLAIGAQLVRAAHDRAAASGGADREDAERLGRVADALLRPGPEAVGVATDPGLCDVVDRWHGPEGRAAHGRELRVVVDRERGRFSAWYELFPRSCSPTPDRPGTFADCQVRLDYVAELGFDVVYLPPIHPIGRTHRKGRNNRPATTEDSPGSPWAIGAIEGGHKAVHPALGTIDDFRRLVARARALGLEIALDIAFQCSPDHPYVREHPEWFRRRPDGKIQYAENPPKKYEDIYPFDFESEHWRALWDELRSVFEYWVQEGVRTFRVDNPHTKPFPFWEWLIADVKRAHPDVIFLSEAFTRPKVMYRLAKLGFTQSYTYFAWRNTKLELTQYFEELTQTKVREFFRPNLWPNTPDILTEHLQTGGRPAFAARLVLAATLGASYGIYGPPFELCEATPREPGSEEYLDSEKYEVRQWDLERPGSLRDMIARVNRIRRENPALHGDWSLRFHPVDNDQMIAYTKQTEDRSNVVLTVVNLDPHHRHSGWLDLPLNALGIDATEPYQAHDLLTDERYVWSGPRNYVELSPGLPAHIFRLRRRLRREQDFEYYL